MLKSVLCISLLTLTAACGMYGNNNSNTSNKAAAANCKDWNYKPGTRAYNDCVANMSSVQR